MFKLLVCVCILIAFVCADYDFQDSDFNKLLVDDLTSEVALEEPHRLKRNADNDVEPTACEHKRGNRQWDYHCCSGGKANLQEVQALKEAKKNCVAEVRGDTADEVSYDPLTCAAIQSRRQQIVCVGECVAKKFDLLEENGDLNRDALLEHSTKIIGDHKWKAEVVEEYIDKCLDELKKVEKDDDSQNDKCNPHPLQFHHCMWRQFVQGCPAESQINSRKCKKIRERLAEGGSFNGDKYFKSRFHLHH